MARRNHHAKPYDAETLLKLELFANYAESWIPNFAVRGDSILKILDVYAGPGCDLEGTPGSPLRLLEVISKFTPLLQSHSSMIHLTLNEYDKVKFEHLCANVARVMNGSNDLKKCVKIELLNEDAARLLKDRMGSFGSKPTLLYLDQNGIRAMSPDIFDQLATKRHLDLLMFTSTQFILRFGQTKSFAQHHRIDMQKLRSRLTHEIHREVTDQLNEYYSDKGHMMFASFSIRKDSNIYGVVFGSSSLKGLEKFLVEAWKINPMNGDASWDIDDDADIARQRDLFHQRLTKIEWFEVELSNILLEGKMLNNRDVYEFTVRSGFLTKHATAVLRRLKSEGKILYAGHPLISWEGYIGKPKHYKVGRK